MPTIKEVVKEVEVVVEKVVDEVPALTQTVQYVRTTHQLA